MSKPKVKRTLTGLVVGDRMAKSVVVRIDRRVKHPLYRKFVLKSRRIIAHDENQECRLGDRVTIAESRPISRRKSWRLLSINKKAVPVATDSKSGRQSDVDSAS